MIIIITANSLERILIYRCLKSNKNLLKYEKKRKEMLDEEYNHRISSMETSPLNRNTPYNTRVRNSNVASSQIGNDFDNFLADKRKVISIADDILPQISPLRNFDPRMEINSLSNLKEELTKNFQFKKMQQKAKKNKGFKKIKFDQNVERGRNIETPIKQIDNSRRFLSSSDIKESAQVYLRNQEMINIKQNRHKNSINTDTSIASIKPSDVLKRNLYKLEQSLK